MKLCICLFVILFFGSCLAITQPPIELPKPAGQYTVGTKLFHWVDTKRKETLYENAGNREILVQIWYPAEGEKGKSKSIYAENLDTARTGTQLYNLYSSVITNSYKDLPVLKRDISFPVIFFSTGRAMASFVYTVIAEELASQGYVFVAINSPGSSQVFFENRYVQPLQRWVPPVSIYVASDSMDKFFSEPIDILSQDILFCIDKVKALNKANSFFDKSLDMKNIGMMGHSLGGLAASEACRKYKKSKALLLIEATQSAAVRKNGIKNPVGFVISELSLSFDKANIYTEILNNLKDQFYFIKLKDAGHNSFTDYMLVRKGLFNYAMLPERGIDLAKKLISGFFDLTLKQKGTSFDNVKINFNEVDIKVY